jgi:aspartate kinase
VPTARRMARISFEELLEMTATGCPKPAMRSVEFARRHGVDLHVRSSFTWEPGTRVTEEDVSMEQAVITAVTSDDSEAKVTVLGVPDHPGIAARLFRSLADENVNVDMIVQNVGADGTTDMTFTVGKADLARAQDVLNRVRAELGYEALLADPEVAKISVVGIGMRSHAGVANTMFRALAEKGINIQVISTSEIKVSVLVGAEYTELAVRALHTAYGLDGPTG